MQYFDSLDKETITLTNVNSVRLGRLAEKLNTTPDKLANSIIYCHTSKNSLYAKDLLYLCELRIKELDEAYKDETLDICERYKCAQAKTDYEMIRNILTTDMSCPDEGKVIKDDAEDE